LTEIYIRLEVATRIVMTRRGAISGLTEIYLRLEVAARTVMTTRSRYETAVVCPRLGPTPLLKRDYPPASLSRRSEWRFTIEDPFERAHDLGTVLHSREGQV
jgi:hypothetical protein